MLLHHLPQLFRLLLLHLAQGQTAGPHRHAHKPQGLLDRNRIDVGKQSSDQIQILQLQRRAVLDVAVPVALADVVDYMRQQVGQHRNHTLGAQ